MATVTLGRQICGRLDEGSRREWLVTDGTGGYAMGTAAGLRTRRYHGLLVVATEPPIGRRLGLASLDPVLLVDGARYELATHEWANGALSPAGHLHLDRFEVIDGVPRWRWSVAGAVLRAELAMARGRPAVGVSYELVADGAGAACQLELSALCTWRDVHGERFGAEAPEVKRLDDGFVFERAYRVRGPGFELGGDWYRGVRYREEAARGLNPVEDLWFAGRFTTPLEVSRPVSVEAWSVAARPEPTADGSSDGGSSDGGPPPADELVGAARDRCQTLATRAGAVDATDELLAHAADQMIVTTPGGPTVVAGYPWFGDWSRDTMTSYEGLFLATGRAEEGAALLRAAGATVSAGMLANTADAGGTEYNTVDGSLWYLHAIGRHLELTGDDGLGAELMDVVAEVVERHRMGTRFGIRVDDDGLLTQGADGWALTWMDARVDGSPITQRRGKPVEVNALWIRGLGVAARLAGATGRDRSPFDQLRDRAVVSFRSRFVRPDGSGLYDVVDGEGGDDPSVRPNQLMALSLPDGPIEDPGVVAAVVRAVQPLVTSIGLRSLSPADTRFAPSHRGGPAERDAAYHQGTVWPWLAGPYLDAVALLGGEQLAMLGRPLLEGLTLHLGEWGLGSVSETADGAVPHQATGCPFQAWSVAELARLRRGLRA